MENSILASSSYVAILESILRAAINLCNHSQNVRRAGYRREVWRHTRSERVRLQIRGMSHFDPLLQLFLDFFDIPQRIALPHRLELKWHVVQQDVIATAKTRSDPSPLPIYNLHCGHCIAHVERLSRDDLPL